MEAETHSGNKENCLQKEKWQITLERLYGSVPNIKRMTKEERNKLAEDITEEEQEILLRKFGLL